MKYRKKAKVLIIVENEGISKGSISKHSSIEKRNIIDTIMIIIRISQINLNLELDFKIGQ